MNADLILILARAYQVAADEPARGKICRLIRDEASKDFPAPDRIAAIREIRNRLGCTLIEAKQLLDSKCPKVDLRLSCNLTIDPDDPDLGSGNPIR